MQYIHGWIEKYFVHHCPPAKPHNPPEYVEITYSKQNQPMVFMYREASNNANTTLYYFHGNAEVMEEPPPFLRTLADEVDCNIVLIEYRGYGRMAGVPTQQKIIEDYLDITSYISLELPFLNTYKRVLFGNSIGAAVALQVAYIDRRVSGVILLNPFLSLTAMSVVFFSMLYHKVLPARSAQVLAATTGVFTQFFTDGLWNNEEIAKVMDRPVFVMNSRDDQLIPLSQKETLISYLRDGTNVTVEGNHNFVRIGSDEINLLKSFFNLKL